jgi:hypothetical protein
MSEIFEKRQLISPSFFQKLLKIKPKENCIIEINNLLSQKDISDITLEEIQSIITTYKINLQKDFQKESLSFYQKYLEFHLKNSNSLASAVFNLEKLIKLLNLDENETKNIFDKLTMEKYSNEVRNMIVKGILDKESEEHLLKIEKDLSLSHDVAMKIYGENAQLFINDFLTKAISDQRFSPEEEQKLNILAKNLHIGLSFDTETKATLDKYKLFWQIENGNIPTIITDISLQKSEVCYFFTDIDWLEQRTVTTRVNYSGPSFRVKITKGLSYRVGSIAPQRITEDIWKTIDSGKLYLTNKRVIFMGGKGNKTITINKILDFNVYTNGIEIQKDSGKSPFLSFSKNTDMFAVILAKLLIEK